MKALKYCSITVVAVTLLLAFFSFPVNASGFYSYIYNEENKAIAAPESATAIGTYYGEDLHTSSFDSPQDMCVYNDKFYIADTKNNRIVITNLDFSDTREIRRFDHNGKADSFSEPTGLCVTDDAVYIADTANARIVKTDHNGKLLMIIEAPRDDAFPDDFFFKPIKIAVDSYGRIFVISSGYNMGLMQFDSRGVYLKSVGAPKVAISIIDQIWRKFSTKEQLRRTQSYVPTEYSNLCINHDGFIFVTSESTSSDIDSLRKLNAKGLNVLKLEGDPSGDRVSGGISYKGNSSIVDFCEIEYGNFAILDRKRSRVFAYNSDSELLYVFGGPGTYSGGLYIPTALEYHNGIFYVLDSGKNAICAFELTEYGKLFNDVADARIRIDSDTEEKLWNEIISENAGCTLALDGLGNVAYKHQDMSLAMDYYKRAGNKENYSKAYAYVRRDWIESHSVVIIIAVLGLTAILKLWLRLKHKYIENLPRSSFLWKLNYSSNVCFRPLNGYWELKRESFGSVGVALLLLVSAIATMIFSNLFTGFIFNDNNLRTYNMLGNIMFVGCGVLLWCIAQWCVTSLMDGEGKFRDIFISTCYAFQPYIVITLFATLFSRVLLINEGDFHYFIITFALLWTLVLLIAGVMQTHNYSLKKTLFVILIVLIVILLTVFIGMLVFAVCQQIVAFVKDIIIEITLRV